MYVKKKNILINDINRSEKVLRAVRAVPTPKVVPRGHRTAQRAKILPFASRARTCKGVGTARTAPHARKILQSFVKRRKKN